MLWFHCEADLISRTRVESLCVQLLEEARVRLGCDFRRVLLFVPRTWRQLSMASSTIWQIDREIIVDIVDAAPEGPSNYE